MAIYRPTKDTKIWWYDFIFEGQRVRESAKTRSKTVARDAERVRRREIEESYNGIKRRDRAKLFSVAAEEWLALKAMTLSAYATHKSSCRSRSLRVPIAITQFYGLSLWKQSLSARAGIETFTTGC